MSEYQKAIVRKESKPFTLVVRHLTEVLTHSEINNESFMCSWISQYSAILT